MAKFSHFVIFLSAVLLLCIQVVGSPTSERLQSDILAGIEDSKVVLKTEESSFDAVKKVSQDESRDENGPKIIEREVAEEEDDSPEDDKKAIPVKESNLVKSGRIFKTAGEDSSLDKTLQRVPGPVKSQIFNDFNMVKSNDASLSKTSRYTCFRFTVFSRSYRRTFSVRSTLWHVRYVPFSGYRYGCLGKITYSGRFIYVGPYCSAYIYYFRA